MRATILVAALAAFAAPVAAQQHDSATMCAMHGNCDTAFAAMQRRGAAVMGVDQYTSRHVFEPLPDGGRIELQRAADDTAGVAQIRHHLHAIAEAFASGDFTSPALVHMQQVPGTDVMAAKRALIRYDVTALPGGGQVRITTQDPDAVAAVHAFLAYQRDAHHAPAQ